MTVLALLSGMLVVGGLVLLVAVVAGYSGPAGSGPWTRWHAKWKSAPVTGRARRLRQTRRAGAVVVFAVVWLVSGVIVFAALAGAAVVGVPWLLSSAQAAEARIARLEAVAGWTQSLADSLRLGISLEQALQHSHRGVPEAIAEPVGQLSWRLQAGATPHEALLECGDQLDDVLADRVIAALILNTSTTSRGRSTGLANGLQDLAASVRDEVAKRRDVESDRAKPRTTVRWLTVILGAVIAFGAVLAQDYSSPYGTLLGQLVLALVVLGFVATLVWMRSLAQQRPIPRFLVPDPRSAVRHTLPRPRKGQEASGVGAP